MFVTFGNSAQKAMQAAKLKTTLAGPAAAYPSMASAIEYCINNTDALAAAQAKAPVAPVKKAER
jgi:hypothetical protein